MRCPNCDFDNPENVNYCGNCGEQLLKKCRHCSFENPPNFRFCGQCGKLLERTEEPATPLRQNAPQAIANIWSADSSESRRLVPKSGEAERRQLTVMFCDLVGSTSLAVELDPEELREVVRRYQRVCAGVVSHYEGRIAQYLGDGILVYYGFPLAHEDDPRRAVYSALDLLQALKQLNEELQAEKQFQLAVRIGIHTGLVVVGEVGGGETREQLALGDTPNLAARLQGLAEPNAILISDATRRLTRDYFELESIGMPVLKGISKPLEVFRVICARDLDSRLAEGARSELTPMIGREREFKLLAARWQAVQQGQSCTVLVSGEAGIGKSRLVKVFKERLDPKGMASLECRCSPYHQTNAFFPLIALLRHEFDLKRDDVPVAALAKVERRLDSLDIHTPETVVLLAGLLAIPLGDKYDPLNLSPARLKVKTIDALHTLLMKMAEQQPVLFVVEDLHWADTCTRDFLSYSLKRKHHGSILRILTFRPEFEHEWSDESYTTITMGRLKPQKMREMIMQVTRGKKLPEEIVRQIISRTDGIPLFIEELTKMMLESGLLNETEACYELSGPLRSLGIPTTLRDSLMARLDRLAPAKLVAQLGAVIGREFTFELLLEISDLKQETLREALDLLVNSELLFMREVSGEPSLYVFRHALIQEAAYESLLKSTRQRYHRRLAEVLIDKYPETTADEPEILAHHFTEAGMYETAIAYWLWSGQRSLERSAIVEAIRDLSRGVSLLSELPPSPKRDELELELLISLGPAFIARDGYGAESVIQNYQRAWELCQKDGLSTQKSIVVLGLWESALIRAELDQALELSGRLLRLAEGSGDPEIQMTAQLCAGVTAFHLGEFVPARQRLELSIELYDPQLHGSMVFSSGQDPCVVGLTYLAQTLWELGYPDQAWQRCEEALEFAQQLDHPFTLALALNFACGVRGMRREAEHAMKYARWLIEVAREQDFAFWLSGGLVAMGYSLFEMDRREEGLASMERGMKGYQTTMANVGKPGAMAVQAQVFGKNGQVQKGLATIDEAIEIAETTKQKNELAELYRLKAELLLMQNRNNHQVAEEFLNRALETARQQSARSAELRSTMALCRLQRQLGNGQEACQRLQTIYDWFQEGHETKDLQEARALLAELQQR